MGIGDKIKEIEDEMARTQKNKATEYHWGQMKARLAKLKTMQDEAATKKGPKGEGFDVEKNGHARVVMIGFPSVGKSSILNQLCNTESEAAAYEFTTLTCIPGVLYINDAKMQLLDLPGIIEGAADGKGRGRQVIAVGKSADLILMVLDCQKGPAQRAKLTSELEYVGIRLNKEKPDIRIWPQKTGGIQFNATCKLTKIDKKMVTNIMHEYKLHNAHVTFRGDYDVDELIDVIEGNRKYIKCLYVYNKIDTISIEEVDEISQEPLNACISIHMELGLDILLQKIWKALGMVRIYTKRRGEAPDFTDPIILTKGRGGLTIYHAILQIHKSLLDDFASAHVWGKSCKFSPMRCGLQHQLCDEDVLQAIKKVSKTNRDPVT